MFEGIRNRWNDWLDTPSNTAQWLLKHQHAVFYTAGGVLIASRGISGLMEAIMLWLIYQNTLNE